MRCKVGSDGFSQNITGAEIAECDQNKLNLLQGISYITEAYSKGDATTEDNLLYDIKIDPDIWIYFDQNSFISVVSDLIDCVMVSAKETIDGKKLIVIQSEFKRIYSGQGVVRLSIRNYPPIDKFGDKVDDLPSKFVHIDGNSEGADENNCFKNVGPQTPLRIFKDEKAVRAKKIIEEKGGKIWLRDNFLLGRGGGLSFEFTMQVVDD